ncbi:hypothetical protein H632_c2096p0 [Helicosporidium sp. ATCC 50920]|nr:hypothetical protein H632_c2096p0 [Helicosporidium sp. ATCC 50920]|eukprot:KDD73517.1 hypothetical protein H632_c2096p0 [Helicosporidium sp. ATCC 50920]
MVNTYPMSRSFTVVGPNCATFVAEMLAAVESALEAAVPAELVKQRTSSSGTYASLSLGPVTVSSPDQVLRVLLAIRADARVKACL